MKKKKGLSEIGIIFSAIFALTFIIIPLFGFIFDNLKMQTVALEVVNGIDSALADTYHSMSEPILSERLFYSQEGTFRQLFDEKIKEKLRLDSNYEPLENSLIEGLVIEQIRFVGDAHLPFTDSDTGKIYNRPFIEVTFTTRHRPLMLHHKILPGKDYVEITSTRKMSLPVD